MASLNKNYGPILPAIRTCTVPCYTKLFNTRRQARRRTKARARGLFHLVTLARGKHSVDGGIYFGLLQPALYSSGHVYISHSARALRGTLNFSHRITIAAAQQRAAPPRSLLFIRVPCYIPKSTMREHSRHLSRRGISICF